MKALNNYRKKYLPSNFANDLLNAEMELEVGEKGRDIRTI